MEEIKSNRLTINTKEAAKRLNICENSMRILVNSKGFPKIKCGRRILIPIKAFEEWVNKTDNN